MENNEVSRDYIDFKTRVLIGGPQMSSSVSTATIQGSVNANFSVTSTEI